MTSNTWLQTRSELRKVTSIRSTYVNFALSLTVTIAIGFIVANMRTGDWSAMSPAEQSDVDPIEDSLLGIYIVQILIGSFGVLCASSEYATKTMSSTLTANPNRRRVLAAKILTVSTLIGIVSMVLVIAGLALGISFSPGASPPLTTVLKVAVGTSFNLVTVALFGLFLGFLTRSTAAAIGILLAVMVLPAIVVFAPEYTTYLPARVGQALMLTHSSPSSHLLSPHIAAALLLTYLVTLALFSAAVFQRRDA